jgi:hypothetical protein
MRNPNKLAMINPDEIGKLNAKLAEKGKVVVDDFPESGFLTLALIAVINEDVTGRQELSVELNSHGQGISAGYALLAEYWDKNGNPVETANGTVETLHKNKTKLSYAPEQVEFIAIKDSRSNRYTVYKAPNKPGQTAHEQRPLKHSYATLDVMGH